MSQKLSTTQETILKAAAERLDRNIEPLPANINAGIKQRVIDGLHNRGLIDQQNGLYLINEAGFQAVGLTPPAAPKPPRENTKQAKVIAMLRGPAGASINEICTETGWLTHTTRAVISNTLKKRLGLNIVSEKEQGQERRYRIIDEPGDQ